MGDVIDGIGLAFNILSFVASLAFMAFWFRMIGRFMREAMAGLNPTFNRNPPSGKVLLRRLWCRHRAVARVRNGYGLNYTACTACGIDVSKGNISIQPWSTCRASGSGATLGSCLL